ncbi:MAG: hypothetical protein IJ661_10695 [Lachnospiraceae bacterium]|nr:hypothetical protein [Lachnospiraceae bacterium]
METVKKDNPKIHDEKPEYFIHGNVKIIISEHFQTDGKTLECIVEDAVMREARYAVHYDTS